MIFPKGKRARISVRRGLDFAMSTAAFLLILNVLSCASAPQRRGMNGVVGGEPGETIILVHGAFQSAESTWTPITTALNRAGLRTVAVDLPARDCRGPAFPGVRLANYVSAVEAAIANAPGPVVLVGHSFGGISISQAAERNPEKVRALIYVAAFLPQNGDSARSIRSKDPASGLSRPGTVKLVEENRCVAIEASMRGDLFANDLAGGNREAVATSVLREPAAPMGEVVSLTGDRFGKIPKHFVLTSKDQVLTPELQKMMIAQGGVGKVFEVDSGHAPYASQPERLTEILKELVRNP